MRANRGTGRGKGARHGSSARRVPARSIERGDLQPHDKGPIVRGVTLRAKLAEIQVEIDQAERAPMLYVAQPGRLFGLVQRVGGLLEAIVVHLERSSTHAPEGTDRHV